MKILAAIAKCFSKFKNFLPTKILYELTGTRILT